MFEYNQWLSSSLTITDKVYDSTGELYTGVIFFEKEKGFLDGQYVKEGVLTQEPYIPLCVSSWMPEGHEFSFISGVVAEEEGVYVSLLQYIDTEEVIHGINLVRVCFDEAGRAHQQTYYDKDQILSHYTVFWENEKILSAMLQFKGVYLYYDEYDGTGYNIHSPLLNHELYKSRLALELMHNKVKEICLDSTISEQDLTIIREKATFFPYTKLEQIFSIPFAQEITLQNYYETKEYDPSILEQFYEYRETNNIDNVKEIVQKGANNLHSFLSFPGLEVLDISCFNINSYSDNGILRKIKEHLKEYKNRYGRTLYQVEISYSDTTVKLYPRHEDV